MVGEGLAEWLAEGISVEITESDVIEDLDAWFLTTSDHLLPASPGS